MDSSANKKLDPAFYKKLYHLDDSVDIFNHYNTIGNHKNLIPNEHVLSNIMAEVLNLNVDVYRENSSVDLKHTIGQNNPTMGNKEMISHFFGNLLDDVEVKTGQLVMIPIQRLVNSIELVEFNTKWDRLLVELFNYLRFDSEFYMMFYKIEDMSQQDSQKIMVNWLKHYIQRNYFTNEHYMNEDANMSNVVGKFLHDKNIDVNYIYKTYGSFITFPADLNECDKANYLFFNFGKKHKFFWNNQERVDYMNMHAQAMTQCLSFIREMKQYDSKMIAQNKGLFQAKLNTAIVVSESIPKPRKLDQHVDTLWQNVKLLKKITNNANIELFNRINKTNERLDILENVLVNMFKLNEMPENINAMSVKNFILSFIYNVHLAEKTDKVQYMELVVEMAIVFIEALFTKHNIDFVAETIRSDLGFLINSKKVIKFTKLSIQLILLLV